MYSPGEGAQPLRRSTVHSPSSLPLAVSGWEAGPVRKGSLGQTQTMPPASETETETPVEGNEAGDAVVEAGDTAVPPVWEIEQSSRRRTVCSPSGIPNSRASHTQRKSSLLAERKNRYPPSPFPRTTPLCLTSPNAALAARQPCGRENLAAQTILRVSFRFSRQSLPSRLECQ
jgi:hypothetical protein